ncbi:MAG: hypothetical protein DRP46_08120, partial [Candidatus Zixiibacteriota bacterium]
ANEEESDRVHDYPIKRDLNLYISRPDIKDKIEFCIPTIIFTTTSVMIGIRDSYIEGELRTEVGLFMTFMAKYMAVLRGDVSCCVPMCYGRKGAILVSY